MFRQILLASLITAGASLALPAPLLAAATPTAAETAHRHPLERLRLALEQLHLSAAEKSSIHQILEAAKSQIQPILQADKGNPAKLRADVAPIVKDTVKKVLAVLTEPQRRHLRELLHEERAASH